MSIVGDDGEAGRRARLILAEQVDASVPDLADVETMSALRRRWLAGDLNSARLESAIEYLTELPVMRYPALPLLPRIFALKENLTPYDATYVALAEALNCPLVTADAHLSRSPGIRCEVQLVG